MNLKMRVDKKRCCSCGACVVACMDQNNLDPSVQKPFRRIEEYAKM